MGELSLVDIPDGSLLRVEQVASILGLEAGSVRRLIRRGVIPARHIGRRLFILGRDLKSVDMSRPPSPPAVESPEEVESPSPKSKRVRVKKQETREMASGRVLPRVIGL